MSGPAPVVLVLGEEHVLVREEVQRRVDAVVDPGLRALNLAVLPAERAADAVSAARTQPMMAAMRAVVVEELEGARAAHLELLARYAEAPVSSTVMVIAGRGFPKADPKRKDGEYRRLLAARRALEAAVRRTGEVVSFDRVRADRFARDRARRAGCTLEPAAARLLVELVGEDLGRVDAEVDKLVSFVGGSGAIDAEAVAAACSAVAGEESFALANALAGGDRDAALRALRRLLDQGTSPHMLLGQVAWQFRNLLELQEHLRGGGELPGYWRGRAGRRYLDAARRMLRRRPLSPARAFEALARANRRFNRSRADTNQVLEALVLELLDAAGA